MLNDELRGCGVINVLGTLTADATHFLIWWLEKKNRSHSVLSISHLWVFDLKHLSLSQDAQVGRFCHHPAVFVPGDGGRRYSVGLTLQSYWFPDQHIHHHRRVPTAVPDAWRNLKPEEMGKYLSLGKTRELCVCTVWMWTHWKLWGECACRPLLLRSWPHSCTFPHQILLLSESGVSDHLKRQMNTVRAQISLFGVLISGTADPAPIGQLTVPGMIRALALAWMGPFSFSQLKVGGGKPVASQERDTKLFTTTVTVSGFRPIMVGGTKSKAKWKYIYMSKLETATLALTLQTTVFFTWQ